MNDIITLSSDEEDHSPPPKKRVTLTSVNAEKDIITLSDGEETTESIIKEVPTSSTASNSKCALKQEVEIDKKHEESTSVLDTRISSFLNLCEEQTKHSKYDLTLKFPTMKKLLRKCSDSNAVSQGFEQFLEKCSNRAKLSSVDTVIAFNDLYQYLKDITSSEAIDVESEHEVRQLKKIYKTIRLLQKKIKEIENKEVDFDDEEDSSYLQLERYGARLAKVYKIYCKLLNRSPYAGRMTHKSVGFVHSEYNEINMALNKKYKNNEKFPTYFDVLNCIKKCVSENNMEWSESKIQSESEMCFKKLGKLLQHRRKRELYDIHSMLIENGKDPAPEDVSLENRLKANFVEGEKKMQDVCDKFAQKQDDVVENQDEQQTANKQSDESEDESDNSNYVDSESDIDT